jgi:hypothetical protein
LRELELKNGVARINGIEVKPPRLVIGSREFQVVEKMPEQKKTEKTIPTRDKVKKKSKTKSAKEKLLGTGHAGYILLRVDAKDTQLQSVVNGDGRLGDIRLEDGRYIQMGPFRVWNKTGEPRLLRDCEGTPENEYFVDGVTVKTPSIEIKGVELDVELKDLDERFNFIKPKRDP